MAPSQICKGAMLPPSPAKLASSLRPPEGLLRPGRRSLHPPPPPMLPPPPAVPDAAVSIINGKAKVLRQSSALHLCESVESELVMLLKQRKDGQDFDDESTRRLALNIQAHLSQLCSSAERGVSAEDSVQGLRKRYQEMQQSVQDICKENNELLVQIREVAGCPMPDSMACIDGQKCSRDEGDVQLHALLITKMEESRRLSAKITSLRSSLSRVEVDKREGPCRKSMGSLSIREQRSSMDGARQQELGLRSQCEALEQKCQRARARRAELAEKFEDEQHTLITAQEMHGRLTWSNAARRSLVTSTRESVDDLRRRVLEEEGESVSHRDPEKMSISCNEAIAPTKISRQHDLPYLRHPKEASAMWQAGEDLRAPHGAPSSANSMSVHTLRTEPEPEAPAITPGSTVRECKCEVQLGDVLFSSAEKTGAARVPPALKRSPSTPLCTARHASPQILSRQLSASPVVLAAPQKPGLARMTWGIARSSSSLELRAGSPGVPVAALAVASPVPSTSITVPQSVPLLTLPPQTSATSVLVASGSSQHFVMLPAFTW